MIGFILSTFDILSGTIAGVWLAYKGEWNYLILSLLFFFTSGFVLRLLITPVVIFAVPASRAEENGSYGLSYFLRLLASLWIHIAITIWCLTIFFVFANNTPKELLILVLVWSYSVANNPIKEMAWKESKQGDGGDILTLAIFSSLAYITISVLKISSHYSMAELIAVYASFIIFGYFVVIFNAYRKPSANNQTPQFKAGSSVVYPSHGIGKIISDEIQMIGDIELRMLVITFEKDNTTLRIPLSRAFDAGLRPIKTEKDKKNIDYAWFINVILAVFLIGSVLTYYENTQKKLEKSSPDKVSFNWTKDKIVGDSDMIKDMLSVDKFHKGQD